ncbi:hypothetical protein AAHA92_25461 [Salvia divinorum]|uniref:Uncharacterized protein n=1 Tax=Salvia divinorum TaxID=28513 RepID=A0ABD1GDD5_SALDI
MRENPKRITSTKSTDIRATPTLGGLSLSTYPSVQAGGGGGLSTPFNAYYHKKPIDLVALVASWDWES